MVRIQRKYAQSIDEVVQETMRSLKLNYAMNNRIIFRAWDEVSGAADYTVRRFFRDGKLYITVNSSVIRSQLNFQKDIMREKINSKIAQDMLFDRNVGDNTFVKEIIVK